MNNLCQDCEEPATDGSYCKEHADRKRRNNKRDTERRREENKCLGCSFPLSEFDLLRGVVSCSICTENKAEHRRREA